MSNKKISELNSANSISADAKFVIAQNGETLSSTPDLIKSYIQSGNLNISATTPSTSTDTGALVVNGGVGISGRLNVASIRCQNTTPSTGPTSGTMVINGGVGIGASLFGTSNALNVNGITRLSSGNIPVDSTSTGTGTLIVSGGVGISNGLNIGGSTKIWSGLGSTSTSTGALTVVGGVGIGESLSVGSDMDIGNDLRVVNSLSISDRVQLSSYPIVDGTSIYAKIDGDIYSTGKLYSLGASLGNVEISESISSLTNIVLSPGNQGVVKIGSNEVATKNYVESVLSTGPAVNPGSNLNKDGATLNLNNNINLSSISLSGNILSTSTSSGSLVVAGGVGVSGRIYSSTTRTTSTTAATPTNAAAFVSGGATIGFGLTSPSDTYGLVVSGKSAIYGQTIIEKPTNVAYTIESDSKNTGALVVKGGVGINGNMNLGGIFRCGTTSASPDSIFSLGGGSAPFPTFEVFPYSGTVGEIHIGGPRYTSGNLDVTDSLDPSTGALVVAGGVGISKDLNVGGGIKSNNLTVDDNLIVKNNAIFNGNLIVNGEFTTINTNKLSVDDTNIELGRAGTFAIYANMTQGSNIITNLVAGGGPEGFGLEDLRPGMTFYIFISYCEEVSPEVQYTIQSVDFVNNKMTITTNMPITCDDVILAINVGQPSDITANGGGITLKGSTNKTITWSNNNWNSSENWNLSSGKTFKINNANVLTSTTLGTSVLNSSLTSVGTLTSLNVGGAVTMTANTNSISTETGTLVVTGGIGVSGRISANNLVLSAAVTSTSSSTGTLLVTGGVGVSGNINVAGSINKFSGNTPSTSTNTGTLVVTGGIGVSGSIYSGGIGIGGYTSGGIWYGPSSIVTTPSMKLGSLGTIGGYGGVGLTNATSASTSTSTGTLVVEGGVGISGCLNVGGYVTGTVIGGYSVGSSSFGVGQSSTSTSTGTLVVTGGVGVSENLNVGGNITSGGLKTPKIYTTNIGNGTATSFNVIHGLSTRDVIVSVYRNSSPWDTINTSTNQITRSSENQINLTFSSAPSINDYRVVIMG